MSGTLRIGIDIGGTFTDFTVVDDATGEVVIEKVLTDENPENGVLDGLDRLAAVIPDFASRLRDVVHATTLVTNTVLERKGAQTGLITTEGFRDIIEMAREVRYDVYDMFIRLPAPIVPRSLRIGVPERVLADGSVLTALDDAAVLRAAARFQAAGVTAVAVCFLHSYRNPEHERRAGALLRAVMPDCAISLSHEVYAQPREYERFSTTVVDAYVKKVASGYLDRLKAGLASRGYPEQLLVMLSNGGTTTAEAVKQVPVQIIESGPAAGVEAASFFARRLGLDQVLAFDMGGTTAKLCLVQNGKAAVSRTFEVDRMHRFKAGSGVPVMVPVFDLIEIGAGGGSIVDVNGVGLLQVGPQSAASVPGPACYGRGGTAATVTDADLLLGYLDPDYFLGGDMRLDAERSRQALTEVGGRIGLDAVETATGVCDLVNETMASAARVYLAEKGVGASQTTLIATGGAGALHATGLARKIGCTRVIVPPFAGVMSSLGLLTAPLAFERSRAVKRLLSQIDPVTLEAEFDALARDAASLLPDGTVETRRTAGLCYAGQDYAFDIDVTDLSGAVDAATAWRRRFEDAYEALYGKTGGGNEVEVTAIHALVMRRTLQPTIKSRQSAVDALPKGRRILHFPGHGPTDTPVYVRDALRDGQRITGPAVIEERVCTIVVGPGEALTVDGSGCLVIRLGVAEALREEKAA